MKHLTIKQLINLASKILYQYNWFLECNYDENKSHKLGVRYDNIINILENYK